MKIEKTRKNIKFWSIFPRVPQKMIFTKNARGWLLQLLIPNRLSQGEKLPRQKSEEPAGVKYNKPKLLCI